MIFSSELLKLKDLKGESFFKENILWDVSLDEIISQKCFYEGNKIWYKPTTPGYIPYIETTGQKPMLLIMRNNKADYGETIAIIDEIPEEMLNEAIEENKDKICHGMCPINEKIKQWLKKELEIL